LLSLAARMGGALDPVLLSRLTKEAVTVAEQVLKMSLRALDYLPPVDVSFGEYLRAIISADTDLVPHDPLSYRLAFIEAFRQRGILPRDCLSLAPENLLFEGPDDAAINAHDLVTLDGSGHALDLEPRFDRTAASKQAEENGFQVHQWLVEWENEALNRAWEDALGVFFTPQRAGRKQAPLTIQHSQRKHFSKGPDEVLAFQVSSVRMARRTGPDGQDLRQLIVQVVQRRRGYFDRSVQAEQDAGLAPVIETPDFWFRGGATMIIDLREGQHGKIRRLIRKPIDDDARLEVQRLNLVGAAMFGMTYATGASEPEPFAIAHRC
jgi:hypothetical protein